MTQKYACKKLKKLSLTSAHSFQNKNHKVHQIQHNRQFCIIFLSLTENNYIFLTNFQLKLIQQTINMALSTTTDEEIKSMSAPMIGFIGPDFSRLAHEAFKAKFGITVGLCTKVWNMIVATLNADGASAVAGFCRLSVIHILYGFFFLRMYPTSRQATATLGKAVGRNQFQKYAQFIIRRIAGLSNEVVSKVRKKISYSYFIS